MTQPSRMQIEAFFDPATSTISYLVLDTQSAECAIIDSVLDYDPKSGRTRTTSADRLVARVRDLKGKLQWILETHVHAEHISAAPYLKEQLGGQIAIGSHVNQVQMVFGKIFNTVTEVIHDQSQFDRLLGDEDRFNIGTLNVRAMHTPGHTPACMTYVVDSGTQIVAFVGDTLFMPDFGTARCDFPGGDARELYQSISRILALPSDTMLYTCHDYQPGGRALRFACTVAEAAKDNIHVSVGVTEEEFIAMRETRDATLDMPLLLLPSIQINMYAGRLPEPENNGVRYLKIPGPYLAAIWPAPVLAGQ